MAHIVMRKNKRGQVTSYQVRWRLGGGSGEDQSERFEDEESAEVFRDAVDGHGQQWPPGWVKGRGFIDPEAADPDDERYRFDRYAHASISARTGIEERYREAIRKELTTYLLPTFGTCDVRSAEHFNRRTIGAWVNQLEQTLVWRGSERRPMSPKTIKNVHGLLSSILKEATQEEPPLRARNPCELTRLPRIDDDGIDEDGEDEDMCFLEPHEVGAIVDQLPRPEDKVLVRVKYATGLRWGELSALIRRNVFVGADGERRLRVARAWKRQVGGGYYVGKPKSTRSRRTIRISVSTWDDLLEVGMATAKPGALLFHDGAAGRLPYSTFYDRWVAAVERAHDAGTLPAEKHPTLHDLRHSHASALLSAGRGLTYVQRRLGHGSITTTSDRYGHLLAEADDDAMEVIERSLSHSARSRPESGAEADVGARGVVFAAYLGDRLLCFRDLEAAETTAGLWERDRGEPVRVERWTHEWWLRSVEPAARDLRDVAPGRVWVVRLGPAVYAADGSEVAAAAQVEPVGEWVWEWEEGYPTRPAEWSAVWRPGSVAETVASAWGTDEDAVRALFGRARAEALRICAAHPAAVPSAVSGGLAD